MRPATDIAQGDDGQFVLLAEDQMDPPDPMIRVSMIKG
jgi:hypothetical protein